MKIYIVFSPSRTASLSIFKLLKDNNRLPAIHTHDLQSLSIYDTETGTLSKIFNKDFANLNINKTGDLLNVNFPNLYMHKFWNLIKIKNELKIITCFRHPIDRSISSFLNIHSIEYIQKYVNISKYSDLNISNLPNNLNYLESYLDREYLDIDDIIKIYDKLYRNIIHEYMEYYRILITIFNIVYTSFNEDYQHKIYDNIELFTFKYESIDLIRINLIKFLKLKTNVVIPDGTHVTDGTQNFVFDPKYKIEEIRDILETYSKQNFIDFKTMLNMKKFNFLVQF
jgi:hypothetical protein